MKKPISFKIAAWLYLVGMICGLSRDLIYQSFDIKPSYVFWNPSVFGLLILISLVGFYFISKGLNWVRIVALLQYTIAILSFLINLAFFKREIEFSMISAFLVILSYAFRGASIYIMFNASSNKYIKSTKK